MRDGFRLYRSDPFQYGLCMGYLMAHWRGTYSLSRSLWINFVALRIAVYFALAGLLVFEFIPLSAFVVLIATDIALFTWQVVGLIRSCEAHIAGHGSLAPVWGSYLVIVLTLFVFGTLWLGLFQHTIPRKVEEPFSTRMEREHASTYKLTLSDDKATLTLDGDVALGSTKAVRRLFSENPSIRSLVLNSTGGNIYEARGVARLVREHGLDTHIDGECSSACTIIFISGKTRTMAAAARLGFHQYRLDTTAYVHNTYIPNVDIAAEQERDRSFFERQAINQRFLDKIFKSPHSDIWFPARDELLAAGVITQ
ncbi:MAG: hypothetical protein LJE67_02045 [Salaquimonas sp.]|nr:hypothetical protein [Salaquimonas sp.]